MSRAMLGLASALLLPVALATSLAGGPPVEVGSSTVHADANGTSTVISGNTSSGPPMQLVCTVLSFGIDGASHRVSCNGTVHQAIEPEFLPAGTRMWWQSLLGCLGCVVCAAFAAGLTLGLTSFDEFGLRVLCNLDVADIDPDVDEEARSRAQQKLLQDQQYAQKIIPLISGSVSVSRRWASLNPTSGHVLLVTLLMLNACANEALPIFLDKLVPEWMAIALSVTVVLIFGEIVPSAIFTGPSQLRLAAFFAPVIRCIRILLFPVVWPISLLLDKCLGHEVSENRRGEMKATAKTLLSAGLEPDEVNMIHGVLDMHHKSAEDIAKPLCKARMVAHDDLVTKELIDQVLGWGHSRVFVYHRDPAAPEHRSDIVNVLLVKKLLGVNLEEAPRVDSVHQALKEPVILDAGENLLSVLNKFQDGMCHLAVVRAAPPPADFGDSAPEGPPTMFCSLEDVIETMLTEDIFDEADLELGRVGRVGTILRLSTMSTRTPAGLSEGLRSSVGRLPSLSLRRSRAESAHLNLRV